MTILAARAQGPVEKATRAELRKLGVKLADCTDAAVIVSLARQVDNAKGAVAAATAGRQVHEILAVLRKRMAEERPRRSQVDELRARRAAAR